MTAQEMIYQVLAKVGMTEYKIVPNALYSQMFSTLNRVYRDVWNSYPFRDEKLLTMTITTSKQDIIMQKEIEVIRAARTSTDPLTPMNEIIISNYAPSAFAEVGPACRYMLMPDSPLLIPLTGLTGNTLTVQSTDNADFGKIVNIWGNGYPNGIDTSEQLILGNSTTPVSTTLSYNSIISISKESTVGDIIIKQGSTVQGYIKSWEDKSSYRRIRLLPAPTSAQTYYFECVRRFIPLVYDQDSILLSNVESVVFDLLVAEAYEINDDSQYERGAIERQKAAGRLQAALDRQEGQEQVDMRSFPESGMFCSEYVSIDTSKTGTQVY